MPLPEIRILSSNILRGVLQEIAPRFEQEAACKLTIAYGPPGQIRARLAEGDKADLALLGAPGIETLLHEDLVLAESRIDIATNRIGVAVRAGAIKPDVGSVEAVTRMLLAAKAI